MESQTISSIQSYLQRQLNREKERVEEGHDIYSKREVEQLLERLQAAMDECGWNSAVEDSKEIPLLDFKDTLVRELNDSLKSWDYDGNTSISLDYEKKIEVEFDSDALRNDIVMNVKDTFAAIESWLTETGFNVQKRVSKSESAS